MYRRDICQRSYLHLFMHYHSYQLLFSILYMLLVH